MSIGKSAEQTWGVTVYVVYVLLEPPMERRKCFQEFSHVWEGEKGGASFVREICSKMLLLL